MNEGKLIVIPEELRMPPPKSNSYARRNWLAQIGRLWIQMVQAGEEPFTAGKRLGVNRDTVLRWIKEKRLTGGRINMINKTPVVVQKVDLDKMLNDYLECRPGSPQAVELMEKIKIERKKREMESQSK